MFACTKNPNYVDTVSGVGIGLSTAWTLVKFLGGRIKINSIKKSVLNPNFISKVTFKILCTSVEGKLYFQ